LKPEEDPGPMDFADLKSQKAMETLYSERFSPDALAQFKKEFEKRSAEKKQQTAAGQADSNPHLYQEIYNKLFETEPLEDAGMSEAARSRAGAVVQELTGPGGLEPSRLSVLEPAAAPDLMDGMVACKLTLSASK
jgi:hypothetical protein